MSLEVIFFTLNAFFQLLCKLSLSLYLFWIFLNNLCDFQKRCTKRIWSSIVTLKIPPQSPPTARDASKNRATSTCSSAACLLPPVPPLAHFFSGCQCCGEISGLDEPEQMCKMEMCQVCPRSKKDLCAQGLVALVVRMGWGPGGGGSSWHSKGKKVIWPTEKKENIILLFNARFAHFLTHEKDLRASPKIMEDVERYHKDIQR